MKKEPVHKSKGDASEEMLSEYHFDYQQAKPNRFAKRAQSKQVVVTLAADVAEVFTTPESVNEVLRALIRTMPKTRRVAGS